MRFTKLCHTVHHLILMDTEYLLDGTTQHRNHTVSVLEYETVTENLKILCHHILRIETLMPEKIL